MSLTAWVVAPRPFRFWVRDRGQAVRFPRVAGLADGRGTRALEQRKFIESYPPIGGFGPRPGRLREQFEGVIWRFRNRSRWREMPGEFGPWPTVYGRFRVWRDAAVFTALLVGVIAEAPAR